MNRIRFHKRQRPAKRRGAAMLEVSLTLGLFLMVTLGMFDFGVGVFRYHVIAQAARQGARRAIVHGEMAPAGLGGPWGIADVDLLASANGTHDIIDGVQDGKQVGIQQMLVACKLEETRIQVQWLDGANAYEDRVRVTVTTPYQPIVGVLLPDRPEINLTASSTMQIAH